MRGELAVELAVPGRVAPMPAANAGAARPPVRAKSAPIPICSQAQGVVTGVHHN